ncbi:MAG: 7-cyano-7-deazaguanine synthase [Leptospirillum sp.]
MKVGLLLSGGMDSICIAYWKRPDVAFTIDYGQLPADAEIAASEAICKRFGIEHHIIRLNCSALGSGDMAGTNANRLAPASDWWPFRNQLIVTFAAMRAVTLGITHLWIGTVQSDRSHQDGTFEFVDMLSKLLSLQEGGLTIDAPAIHLTTIELFRLSGIQASQLAWSHSCHKANVACGNCRGCNKYFEVLRELDYDMDRLGESDPLT